MEEAGKNVKIPQIIEKPSIAIEFCYRYETDLEIFCCFVLASKLPAFSLNNKLFSIKS